MEIDPSFVGGRATAPITTRISKEARLEDEVVGCGDELVDGIWSAGGIGEVDSRL